MKKLIFIFALGFISTTLIIAQTVQVTPGSTRTFTVNLLNGVTLHPNTPYTWSHSGSGIISATASTNTYSVQFSNTVGSTGHIEVYATSEDNCNSDIKQLDVTVEPLKYNANFAQASQDVCPQTTGNPTGGDAAAVNITFTGGNVASFVYALDGVATTVTLSTPSTTYTLDVITSFTNAEAGAHTLEIVSITGADNITSLLPNGSVVHIINVDVAPVISDIF